MGSLLRRDASPRQHARARQHDNTRNPFGSMGCPDPAMRKRGAPAEAGEADEVSVEDAECADLVTRLRTWRRLHPTRDYVGLPLVQKATKDGRRPHPSEQRAGSVYRYSRAVSAASGAPGAASGAPDGPFGSHARAFRPAHGLRRGDRVGGRRA